MIATFGLSLAGCAIGFWAQLRETVWMWVALVGVQVPTALVALRELVKEGEWRARLEPRWGDLTIAALTAGGMLLFLRLGVYVASPMGGRIRGWLEAAYAQVGSSAWVEEHWGAMLGAVVVLAVLSELSWRGLVLRRLEQRLGSRRAWPVTGLLYGLSYLPTMWLLSDQGAVNPVVPLAACLAGSMWSFVALRFDRLMPAILSHGLFLWFVIAQLRFFV